jgi:quercetin dioxygenase-like cupin family protein
MSSTAVINVSNAPHYIWGGTCDGWRLLDGAGLSVTEERMPAGGQEDRHFHAEATQLFYVLKGRLNIEVDGRVSILNSGDALSVFPKAKHEVRNDSATDVQFLVISAPATHNDKHHS